MNNNEILQEKFESGNFTNTDVQELLEKVDAGELRVAEKQNSVWKVNEWVKKGLLANFPLCEMYETETAGMKFRDKWPLKENFENVRIVPGGNSVRKGAYLAPGVVMMPPAYVNLGAYVDEGTMIDSHALVGSCAQIGKNVHLSAAVQIGGVLEPVNASPVIVEDNCFLSAGVIVVEGVIVETGAVLGAGVIISASTKIIETNENGKIVAEYKGRVPANAIVIPGARQRGEVMVQTPIIIGYKTDKHNEKLSLNEMLRNF